MRRSVTVVAASLAFLLLAAVAAAVELVVQVAGDPAATARVVARSFSNTSGEHGPMVELEAPGTTQLDLDPAEVWTIEVTGPGLWPASLTVNPAGQPDQLAVARLWPTGSLAGRLAVADGETMPEELAIRFEAAPGSETSLPSDQQRCPVNDGAWRCELPAGRLDLRLRATGFISHYRWDLQVAPHADTELGLLELVRGASVVGRVEVERPDAQLEPCSIELSPLAASVTGDQADLARRKKTAMRTTPNERGFFHLKGVKPGSYLVSASYEGMATARFFPVTVMEGAETALVDTLRVEPPASLELQLLPELDVWHRRWRTKLLQRGANPSYLREVSRAEADLHGMLTLPELEPGAHVLRVLDQDGNRWLDRDLDLRSGLNRELAEIPVVLVAGSVHLGDRPFAATLWFGGKHGSERLRLESNDDGAFEGYLPHEGRWRLTLVADNGRLSRNLTNVDVSRREGAAAARVEIVLPDTRLEGEVVDQLGEPVAKARVQVVLDSANELPVETRCDEDGRFQLEALAAGPLVVEATTSSQSAEPQLVQLTEGETTTIRLVLQESTTVTGQVVGGLGAVPGASVYAFPIGMPSAALNVSTDINGIFELSIPHWSSQLSLIVMAPGFALHTLQLPVTKGEQATIQLRQASGTVILDPGDLPLLSREQPLLLVHNQVPMAAGLLLLWARMNGMSQVPSDKLVLPGMEEGGYSLCVLDPTDTGMLLTAARSGLPESICPASGSLLAGAELRLTIPTKQR